MTTKREKLLLILGTSLFCLQVISTPALSVIAAATIESGHIEESHALQEEQGTESSLPEEAATNESEQEPDDTVESSSIIEEENTDPSKENTAEESDNSYEEPSLQSSVSVSTWAQFRTAVNNQTVTTINLTTNISGNTSLNSISRNLTINGNGFQLFIGNQSIGLNNDSVIRLINLELLAGGQPPSSTLFHVIGNNVQIVLNNFEYKNDTIVLANTVGSSSSYSVIFDGGVSNLSRGLSDSVRETARIFASVNSINMLNNSIFNLTNANIDFKSILASEFNISEGSTLNINNSLLLKGPIRHLNTFKVEGKADINIKNANLGPIENVRIESTGEFLLNSDGNDGTIEDRTKNIEIIRGSTFDIKNSSGDSITNGDVYVSIDSPNLAFWELGLQNEEKASMIFSDVALQLAGLNGSEVIYSNNERFQRLYDLAGLASYSRMSNRGVEEMDRFVTAHYESQDGATLEDPETISGFLGEPYQSAPKEIAGYRLSMVPENASGEFTREAIQVIYVYQREAVTPVDPLSPGTEVDPENKPELPEDQGLLSIDFISSFNFGAQTISAQAQTYYAQPQRLLNEDGTVNEEEERPNYVQISDRRPKDARNGWGLAVTQKEQFKGQDNQELLGARISLSNQQVITAQGGTPPGLQSVPCELIPGTKRTLLKAQGTEGTGTWIYRFGDAQTAGVSVALEVPKGANPERTTYSTTLVWELSAVPVNE